MRTNSFFFNDTATTEIYTLSLHDALPISMPTAQNPLTPSDGGAVPGLIVARSGRRERPSRRRPVMRRSPSTPYARDRKSTRLNSSHANISYAVFCLKKNNKLTFTYLHITT